MATTQQYSTILFNNNIQLKCAHANELLTTVRHKHWMDQTLETFCN